MKKIDYIFKVWSDLDTHYSKVASKMSKRTYLEKLIGYNQQVKTSSFLENYVADEVDTYNQEEYAIYERMLLLFNQMFDKLRVAGDDIVDFESFLSQDIHSYNDEDISLYRKDASVSPERLHELGYFMDAVVMQNGKPRAYTVKETDDYRVFYNTSDLAVFLNSEEDFVSEFGKKCYAIITQLAKQQELSVPMVLMAPKYYKVKDDNITIKAIKHKCSCEDLGNVTINALFGESATIPCKFYQYRTKSVGSAVKIIGVA